MRTEPQTAASEWALPLRRRADELMRLGHVDEAGRLLMQIRRALQEEPSGGRHERTHPNTPVRNTP